MSHALYHAESSARRYGGTADDYIELHALMDAPQLHVRMPSVRGRAPLHNTFGVELCTRLFTDTMGVRARAVAEGHVQEDLGEVVPLSAWLAHLTPPEWLLDGGRVSTAEQAALSARRHGGSPEAYVALHALLDGPRAEAPDDAARADALLHNTFGIALCERVFGHCLVVEVDGTIRRVPVRYVAMQHIAGEGGGQIRTLDDCLAGLKTLPWMGGRARVLSRDRSGQEESLAARSAP